MGDLYLLYTLRRGKGPNAGLELVASAMVAGTSQKPELFENSGVQLVGAEPGGVIMMADLGEKVMTVVTRQGGRQAKGAIVMLPADTGSIEAEGCEIEKPCFLDGEEDLSLFGTGPIAVVLPDGTNVRVKLEDEGEDAEGTLISCAQNGSAYIAP